MIGYIAKDKDGNVYLYSEEPYYDKSYEGWFSPEMLNITNEFEEFNSLNYRDKPVRVEIKLKRI